MPAKSVNALRITPPPKQELDISPAPSLLRLHQEGAQRGVPDPSANISELDNDYKQTECEYRGAAQRHHRSDAKDSNPRGPHRTQRKAKVTKKDTNPIKTHHSSMNDDPSRRQDQYNIPKKNIQNRAQDRDQKRVHDPTTDIGKLELENTQTKTKYQVEDRRLRRLMVPAGTASAVLLGIQADHLEQAVILFERARQAFTNALKGEHIFTAALWYPELENRANLSFRPRALRQKLLLNKKN